MIERLVNSKTRMKILKLFLSHIDDRYYLRELERLLDESLSPLRRQLIKLTDMGILATEEEANLKYYRLNKDFEGLEDLKRLVLDNKPALQLNCNAGLCNAGLKVAAPRQFRYDLALLSFISVFVLATAIFMVYANTKSIKQVAKMIATEQTSEAAVRRLPKSDTGNGEMTSKKWKFTPGTIPAFSNVETGGEKRSKEL